MLVAYCYFKVSTKLAKLGLWQHVQGNPNIFNWYKLISRHVANGDPNKLMQKSEANLSSHFAYVLCIHFVHLIIELYIDHFGTIRGHLYYNSVLFIKYVHSSPTFVNHHLTLNPFLLRKLWASMLRFILLEQTMATFNLFMMYNLDQAHIKSQ